jgi:hypothetical protein
LGAIVGGSLGGGVVLVILIIIALAQRRSYKRRQKREESTPYRLRDGYDVAPQGSPPPTGMSERSTSKLGDVYTPVVAYQGINDGGVRYDTAMQPARNRAPINDPRTQAILSPNRPLFQPTRHPYANHDYNDQDYDGDVLGRRGEHVTGGVPSRSATDITLGVLAKEVAKVLMQSPPGGDTKQIEDSDSAGKIGGARRPRERHHNNADTRENSTIDALEAISRETSSPAPPLYRNYQ